MKQLKTFAKRSGSIQTAQKPSFIWHDPWPIGPHPGSRGQYREALRLNPNLAGALNNLAWMLATSSKAEFRDGRKRYNWPNARVN